MLNVRYFLNNVEIKSPVNHKDLTLELNFDQDSHTASLSTTKWRFANAEAQSIINYIDAGLTGGNGIYEGMPFNIVLSDGTYVKTFENYLDLINDAVLSCNDVEVNSKAKQQIEWLNDVADSFTFEFLHERTPFLPSSLFVPCPYVINSIPNTRDIFIASISIFVIINELSRSNLDTAKVIADIAGVFTAPAGAIKAVLLVLYLILLLISLVRLIKDLIDLLIQPVKYHAGMYVRDLLTSACNYLGLNFNSTIFQGEFANLYLLPEKFQNPEDTNDDRLLGFLSPNNTVQKGYYNGTFGDLLRALKTIFNAKVVLIDGTLHLERLDWSNSNASYTIPDIRADKYGTNADEINSNYLIQFTYDVNDKNTIQDYTGNAYQVTTQPITLTDRKLLLLQGLNQQQIPFALGRRKNKLTGVEKVVDAFLEISTGLLNALIIGVNGIINVINEVVKAIKIINKILKFFGFKKQFDVPNIKPLEPVDFGSIINDRIGMLLLENDNVLVPKLFILNKGNISRNNKIPTDNNTTVSAKNLWEKFHFINSFVPSNSKPNGNQYITKEIDKVPFCLEDFKKVLDNNKVFDVAGNEAKIDSLEWNPWNRVAKIKYRVNKLFTKNLKEEYSEPKGY